MSQVQLIGWNPRVPALPGRVGRRIPVGRRVNNFGDLLGPVIVKAVLASEGIEFDGAARPARLISVGSIVHLARDGDTIWGAGANGHHLNRPLSISHADVRAVRGPRTRAYLDSRGINAPAVYGDPGLLISMARPDLATVAKKHEVTACFNLNDRKHIDPSALPRNVNLLSPTMPLDHCLTEIAGSEFVVGSALHALIVADALGIPSRAVAPLAEPDFKYHDYFEGTGRRFDPAETVAEAQVLGPAGGPLWDAAALVAAFPRDLWTGN